MMKNVIKTIAILTTTIFALTGCAENRENEFNINEVVSSVIEDNVTSAANSTTSEVEINVNSDSSTESKPVESSAISEVEEPATSTTSAVEIEPAEKPVESTTTTSSAATASKPAENPAENPATASSATSSAVEEPVETPIHTHNFSKATCEKPATCSCGATKGEALGHNFTNATCNKLATCTICGATKGTFANHNYKDGICTICGEKDPNYEAPHNCKTDGHVWKNYTETSTESVEIVETHDVSGCGYDFTLANRYFGRKIEEINFASIFGNVYGSGSSRVKTTGIKTITRHIHECTECGFNEVYNTEETVTPGDTWTFVNKPRNPNFTVIWYDISNIPDEVYEAVEKDNKESEEFWDTF